MEAGYVWQSLVSGILYTIYRQRPISVVQESHCLSPRSAGVPVYR